MFFLLTPNKTTEIKTEEKKKKLYKDSKLSQSNLRDPTKKLPESNENNDLIKSQFEKLTKSHLESIERKPCEGFIRVVIIDESSDIKESKQKIITPEKMHSYVDTFDQNALNSRQVSVT